MLSEKLKKIFVREAEHLFDDMREFRKDHERISNSIEESKKRMQENHKKRRFIRNK